MEHKNEYISFDSFEHLNPSLWNGWHILVPEEVSSNDTLFENELFQCRANYNAFEIANGCTDSKYYESEQIDYEQHTSKLLSSPSYKDISESDEFWENIMNNEDHNMLAEKYSSEYCNQISPVSNTNYFDQQSPETLDSSLSLNVMKTKSISMNRRVNERTSLDSCQLDPDKIFAFPNFNTQLSTYKVSRKKPRVEMFNSCIHDFNHAAFIETPEQEKQKEGLKSSFSNSVSTKNSHFAVLNDDGIETFMPATMLNFQTSNKMHMNAQYTESIALQHKNRKTKVTNTESLVIGADSSLLADQKKNSACQKKSKQHFKRCLNSHSVNSTINQSTSTVTPELLLHGQVNLPAINIQKTNTDLHITKAVSINAAVKHKPVLPNSSCIERNEDRVSVLNNKSVSSIKIDKKGSLLSLPTNSLNTMMVKDILQLLGHKNERGMKELTMEYRANIMKMMQQKQLRLKQASASS